MANKLSVRYMTDEETMHFIINTRNNHKTMDIKTKFAIGQRVWFATHVGRPTTARITGIKVLGIAMGMIIYTFDDFRDRSEDAVFETKEELLKSL